MTALLIAVHILVCIIMILVVLLQGGKGAEMGAAFGGASQTVFGSAGPTDFLGKLTTWAAVLFMVTCLSLAYLSSGKTAPSVMDKVPVAVEPSAVEPPVAPEGVLPPAAQGEASAPAAETSEGTALPANPQSNE